MQQLLHWCADHWEAVALALSVIVQISPIKIDPWTKLISWLGKKLTAPLYEEIAEVKSTIYTNEIDRIRYEVLDFANSCRNGRKHTKDEFEHIIDLNLKYQDLLEKTKTKNGVFDSEYAYIFEIYQMCQRENKFL